MNFYLHDNKDMLIGIQCKDNKDFIFKIRVAAIITKFDTIFSIVNRILFENPEFKNMYEDFIIKYCEMEDREDRFLYCIESIPNIIKEIDIIYDNMKMDDLISVISKDNAKISITLEDAKNLYRTSIRTRFFIPLYLTEQSDCETPEKILPYCNKGLSPAQSKTIQNVICDKIIHTGVIKKFYKIIESKIKSTNPEGTGSSLWNILSSNKGISPSSLVIELFNSTMYKGLTSIDPEMSPAAYLISIINNESRWVITQAISNVIVSNNNIDISDLLSTSRNNSGNSVIYKIVTKKMFENLKESYSKYNIVYKYNTNSVLYNISQPLLNKIFTRLPIHDLSYNAIHELNFFTHSFLMRYDCNKKWMLTILTSGMVIDDVRKSIKILPEFLYSNICQAVSAAKLNEIISHLGYKKICENIEIAVRYLYKYNYYDVTDIPPIPITFDWPAFIDEYVDYLYKIVSGAYDPHIKLIRMELMCGNA